MAFTVSNDFNGYIDDRSGPGGYRKDFHAMNDIRRSLLDGSKSYFKLSETAKFVMFKGPVTPGRRAVIEAMVAHDKPQRKRRRAA